MPRASSVSGGTDAPGGRRPSFRDAWARILGGLRGRGWVWWLSMLWVVMGAGGVVYAFVGTTVGCTTRQCTGEEILVCAMERGTGGDRCAGQPGRDGLAVAGCDSAGGGVRPAAWLAAAQLAPRGGVGRCLGRGYRARSTARGRRGVRFRSSQRGLGSARTANLRRVAGSRGPGKPNTVYATPQQGSARDRRPFQQASQFVIRRTARAWRVAELRILAIADESQIEGWITVRRGHARRAARGHESARWPRPGRPVRRPKIVKNAFGNEIVRAWLPGSIGSAVRLYSRP